MPGLVEITQWFWFIDCLLFLSRLRIFHSEKDVKIAGEVLQNLGLCSTFMPFWAGLLRYKAEILPIRRKTLNDQSDNQSLYSRYTTRDVVLHGLIRRNIPSCRPLQQTRRNAEWKKCGKFTDWWQTKVIRKITTI